MTERLPSLLELQRTDELLDEIADRRTPTGDDRALDLLASLAGAVDEAPLPELDEQPVAAVAATAAATDAATRRPSHRRGRLPARQLAAALTIGLTLSSTGIAAAVTGDPLLPIKTVVRHLYDVSHEPSGPDSPWILGSDRTNGDSPVNPSVPPPAVSQPQRVGDDKSSEHVRDVHASDDSMTSAERAPADAAGPPAPVIAPAEQETSTSGPTDEQPADDGGQVSGDGGQGDDTTGNGQGEDPGTMRPDPEPTSGDPDSDPNTPPPPPTCTEPDPDHPENVPINPCPTEDPTDPPAGPPVDPPAGPPIDPPGQGDQGDQGDQVSTPAR